MKGRQINVLVLLAAAALLIVAGAGGMIMQPAGEADQLLPARFGDVAYNHELHAHLAGVDCITCHHRFGVGDEQQLKQGVVTPKPCHDCHRLADSTQMTMLGDLFTGETTKSPDNVPGAMEAYHAKCVGCHVAKKQGPVKCYDCHAQAFVGSQGRAEWSHRDHSRKMNMDCASCHHADNEAEGDGDYTNCRQCHLPAQAMGVEWKTGLENHEDVSHRECFTCHVTGAPSRDMTYCAACHDMETPPDTAPSLELAVHARCLACHQDKNDGLPASAPTDCSDCHGNDHSYLDGNAELGPVMWSHARHTVGVDWDCARCHHPNGEGEPLTVMLACDRCHGKNDFGEAPDLMTAMHDTCLKCHVEMDHGPRDPNNCYCCHSKNPDLGILWGGDQEFGWSFWDHRRHATVMDFACRDCHHNTMMADGKSTACQNMADCPDDAHIPQACDSCHDNPPDKAPETQEAVHTVCVTCHERMGSGPLECVQCHLQIDGPDPEKYSAPGPTPGGAKEEVSPAEDTAPETAPSIETAEPESLPGGTETLPQQ